MFLMVKSSLSVELTLENVIPHVTDSIWGQLHIQKSIILNYWLTNIYSKQPTT